MSSLGSQALFEALCQKSVCKITMLDLQAKALECLAKESGWDTPELSRLLIDR